MKSHHFIDVLLIFAASALLLFSLEVLYQLPSAIIAYLNKDNTKLDRYQTLVTGLIAIGAAYISIHGINKQINHDRYKSEVLKYEATKKISKEIEISTRVFLDTYMAVLKLISETPDLADGKREIVVKQALGFGVPPYFRNAPLYSALEHEDLVIIEAIEKYLHFSVLMSRHLYENPLAVIDVQKVSENAQKCFDAVEVLYLGLFHHRVSAPVGC